MFLLIKSFEDVIMESANNVKNNERLVQKQNL